MEKDLQEHQLILDQLGELHDTLDKKRTLTEYTANEGRNIAKSALALVNRFPDDSPAVIGIKAEVHKMLKGAIAIADDFHSNYDYMNRKPKPGAPDPWRVITDTQGAIEYFIDAIVESYQ